MKDAGLARGLICLDLDGTLLDSSKRISAANRAALAEAQQQGFAVALASGRHPFDVFEIEDGLGLPHTAVCFSGALAYEEGSEVFSRPLDDEAVQETIEVAAGLGVSLLVGGTQFNLVLGDIGRGGDAARDARNRYEEMGSYSEAASVAASRRGKILKIALYSTDRHAMGKVRSALAQVPQVSFMRSDVCWTDVLARGCSKAQGIEALAGALDIPQERVVAVGDDENDVAALVEAGVGIAMGNACAAAKEAARMVVADNDHDGAAEAILWAEKNL